MSKLMIVYGGQFGSEGKGQIAAHLTKREPIDLAVRVGGPNAGHTFIRKDGKKQVVQSLPSPMFVGLGVKGIIGAGGLILLDILEREMQELYEMRGGVKSSLTIDANAAFIQAHHMEAESYLKGKIGSTGEGVGSATASKVMRDPDAVVAAHTKKLLERWSMIPHMSGVYISPGTPDTINRALWMGGATVLVEGTQGVGLSLSTSGFYPFCTSRECTPQGILADTGISPRNAGVVEYIMVVRTYPIRVGGNSGPLSGEITWNWLEKETKGYVKSPEITTVTKKIRRIAHFDPAALGRVAMLTRPTAVALTFFDYWHPEMAGATNPSLLTKEMWYQIRHVEDVCLAPVRYISTGFGSVMNIEETK